MRRNLERRLSYLAGAALLLLALGFAALRSEGYGVAVARDGEGLGTVVGLSLHERYAWFAEAETLWSARCGSCHAELDYIPALFAAEGGRDYLVDLMLFGARGEAFIDGEMQSFRHRPFGDQFDDEQMAGLLNLMLLAWGNEEALPEGAELYTAAEVGAARPREIAQDDVLDGRPGVGE